MYFHQRFCLNLLRINIRIVFFKSFKSSCVLEPLKEYFWRWSLLNFNFTWGMRVRKLMIYIIMRDIRLQINLHGSISNTLLRLEKGRMERYTKRHWRIQHPPPISKHMRWNSLKVQGSQCRLVEKLLCYENWSCFL